ncbi:hypothetical protein GEMRC1_013895 [Eukaryota sp. GEM-RC1]
MVDSSSSSGSYNSNVELRDCALCNPTNEASTDTTSSCSPSLTSLGNVSVHHSKSDCVVSLPNHFRITIMINYLSHLTPYNSNLPGISSSTLIARTYSLLSKFGFVSNRFFTCARSGVEIFLSNNLVALDSSSVGQINSLLRYFKFYSPSIHLDCSIDCIDWSTTSFDLSNIRSFRISSLHDIDCIIPSTASYCPNITQIFLFLNLNISSRVALKSIASEISLNNQISYLNLNFNSIDSKGVVCIANALKVNSSITSISLNFNSIDDEGAISFADALITNSTLVFISFTNNLIGNKGALALCVALSSNDIIKKD